MDASGTIVGIGDVAAQLAQVYRNVDAALQAVGADRSRMVRTTTYMTHPGHAPSAGRAAEAFYGGAVPADTAVTVLGLPNPASLVAIEGIAVIE